VLVDGPTTGVARQAVSFKRSTLTDIVVKVPRTIGTASLKLALEKQDLAGKWGATAWAKKIVARDTRANLTDFDRFKLLVARKQRSAIIKSAVNKLRNPSGKVKKSGKSAAKLVARVTAKKGAKPVKAKK
ncbi:ribosomal protein L14-domain-containing protein, partial [Blyttiomyces helicus]